MPIQNQRDRRGGGVGHRLVDQKPATPASAFDNKSGVILGDGTHPVPSVDGTLLYSRAGFIESATFDADAMTLSAVTRSGYTVRTNCRAIDGPSIVAVCMVPDGQSFIVVESADDPPDQLVVMLNGLQALRRS